MAFLKQRDRQPELMDQPGLDEAAHHAALAGLSRVNWISGGVPAIWRHLRSISAIHGRERTLRVLDVACGGGDIVLRLARRARRYGLAMQVDGCDLSETALRLARQNRSPKDLNVQFFRHDALAQPLPIDYDIIMCSLFLHHLDNSDAIALLQNMSQMARLGILIDDLQRTRLGYALCWIGCRILTRSRIVWTDGPLSVRAAFTVQEALRLAKQAGLENVQMQRHWPERFLLSWRRS